MNQIIPINKRTHFWHILEKNYDFFSKNTLVRHPVAGRFFNRFFGAGVVCACARTTLAPCCESALTFTSLKGVPDVRIRTEKRPESRPERVRMLVVVRRLAAAGATGARATAAGGRGRVFGSKVQQSGRRCAPAGLWPSHLDTSTSSRPSRPFSRAPPVRTMAETKKVCIVGSGNW